MLIQIRAHPAILLGLLTMLGSLFVAASPAQAYSDFELHSHHAYVDTDNCQRVAGDLSVSDSGSYCFLNDSADNTYFRHDSGGIATKLQLHTGSGMVAKVEFHPYGEYLWVYDTKNDGDTIYVTTELKTSAGYLHFGDVVTPPGTSDRIEYTRKNFNITDGTTVRIRVYDNRALTVFRGELYAVA